MNTLVSLPIAAALPVAAPAMPAVTDRRALEAYASWLFMERRILCGELWPHLGADAEGYVWHGNAGAGWHFRGRGDLVWNEGPQPSSRAAAVLDLAGVDWRQPKRHLGFNHEDSGDRPPLPASWPAVVDPVIAIAKHAIDAWLKFEARCQVSCKAEEAVIEWKKANPRPEHGAATEWTERLSSIEKATGFTRAERAQDRASERFDKVLNQLYEARPISIEGLRAKAGVARTCQDDGLQQQIVYDIGVLFGDLDQNEKPFVGA